MEKSTIDGEYEVQKYISTTILQKEVVVVGLILLYYVTHCKWMGPGTIG